MQSHDSSAMSIADNVTRLKEERRGLLEALDEARLDDSRCREDIAIQALRENARKMLAMRRAMPEDISDALPDPDAGE